MGGRAPSAPDPNKTASAQMAGNIGTAIANANLQNVNQVTPYGSLSYDQTGTYKFTDPYSGQVTDIPTFTATTSLTKAGQGIQDATMAAQQNYATAAQSASKALADQYSKPFAISKDTPALSTAPSAVTMQGTNGIAGAGKGIVSSVGGAGQGIQTSYAGADNFSADRQRVEDALMARLQPSLDQNRSSADANLIARGVGIGSQAYGATMQQVGQQENDARLGAILQAGQEESRLVGLARDAAAFNNTAQAQGFNQKLAGAQFANSAQAQGFNQTTASQQAANDARAQQFQIALQQGQQQNANRAQSLQEQYAQRGQGVNEFGALLGGTQVQAPNFSINTPGGVQGVDYAGLVQQNYQNKVAAAQSKAAGLGSLLGGVANLGITAATGGVGGLV